MNPSESDAPPDPEDNRQATPSGESAQDALLAAIHMAGERLEARFEARLSYDATKEAAFQHLYADLKDAKLASSLEATRPLLLDLLLLYDRLAAGSREEGGSGLHSFRDELLEVLYRRDVHPIRTPAGRFDPEVQQVVGTVETAEADEDQLVDRVVREGFRWGMRVLRAEDVVIRRRPRPPRPETRVVTADGDKGTP